MSVKVKRGRAQGSSEELEGRGSGGSSSAHGRQELAPAAPTRPEKQNLRTAALELASAVVRQLRKRTREGGVCWPGREEHSIGQPK